MPFDYPIFLDLTGRLVVVVGGGNVAVRKVDKLLAAGARVRVVAPQVHPDLEARAASQTSRVGSEPRIPNSDLEIVRAPFAPAHLSGALLVFACTDKTQVNAQAAAAARAAGALVNRADDPDDCDFYVPAVSEHGPVRLAISTGGASPTLARFIREWLDESLPPELATLAEELARARPIVQQRVRRAEDRVAVWETLCGEESIRLLADKDIAAWRAWFEQVLASHAK